MEFENQTKIHLTIWHFEIKRIDGEYFNLVCYGNTKDGKGKRHKVYLKMHYSFTQYLIIDIKKFINKQIERLHSFISN